MRYSVASLLASDQTGIEVTLMGWVRTKRVSPEVAFIEVNDGSTIKNIQVVVDKTLFAACQVEEITTGCSISVTALLQESPAKGQRVELAARQLTILGLADAEKYPLQKKKHSFEFLRDLGHLRPRTNTFGAVFRVRSALAFAIHKFFNEQGFCYVHTPIITTSDCEGAGQMFQVSTLNLKNVPIKEGKVDYEQDFFKKPAFLTVSGQLEGEAFATALSKIYTFGPTFRAENSNTSRHLSEFWMIEPEMAFYDIHDNMDLAESFLKYIIRHVLDQCRPDMEFFNQFVDKGILERLENVVSNEFVRLSYTDAVAILKKSGATFEFPVDWGIDLQSEHERYLTEKHFKKPVILTDYPKKIKAFYMRVNGDDNTVRAMDILTPGIGEIIGGSQREERLDVLEKRLAEMNLDKEAYEWYLDLRRYGSVVHSGFGLGFERMMMFLTGMTNIRDVIPFPRTPGTAMF
jgi:asparaginyl-tRNA synthetase